MASPGSRSRGGSKEGSRRSRASSNNSRGSTKSGLKGGTEGGSIFNAYKNELEKEKGHDSASIQSAFAQWTCGLCETKDNDCDSEQCHRCGRPKSTKYQWKYDFKKYCMVVKSGPRPVPPEKTLAQKIAEAEAAHLAALEAWRLAHPEEAAGVEPEYEGPWTIQMVVNGAKEIIAADRGGTSDPFAIIELQDSTDKKPIQSGKTKYYVKTRTIRKTLVPVWDQVITWENIARRPESLLVVVKLFDADIVTREPLGEVTLPVVKFPSEKGVVENKWYDLELSGKMKRVKGSVQIETSLEEGPPVLKTVDPARIRGVLVGGRELLAADRGGTSDPFAMIDLIDIRSGKPVIKPDFSEKTKTIKKTLNPTWDHGINWEGITHKPENLGVKISVFDADMMSKEPLGEVVIPVSKLPVSSATADPPMLDDWFELGLGHKMKTVSGAVRMQSLLEYGASKAKAQKTLQLTIVGAKDLIAADKGGTSDPFAIVELVTLSDGLPVKPPLKKQTKTVKKTLEPYWDDHIVWESIAQTNTDLLGVNIKVFDADLVTKEALGQITIPVKEFPDKEGVSADKWYTLEAFGKMKAVSGTINVRTSLEHGPPVIIEHKNTLDFVLIGARDLIAADKSGTSDPFAVVELVDVRNGNIVKPKKSQKTKTVNKTLEPEWRERVVWKNIVIDPVLLAINVKVYDADMVSKEILGEVTIPVKDWPVGAFISEDHWYNLELSGKMKGQPKGAVHVQTRREIQKDDGPAEEAELEPSTLDIVIVEAKDLIAADSGGTSDPYCIAELVDRASGNTLKPEKGKPKFYVKTKTVKKTLHPDFHESITWSDVHVDPKSAALKIRLFDADMLTSTALGEVLIPITTFPKNAPHLHDHWYGLKPSGKMKSATGHINVQTRRRTGEARHEESGHGSHYTGNPGILHLVIVGAKELIAADRSGTSDPYAVVELQHTKSGKAITKGFDKKSGKPKSKTFKVKTKVVKKTLEPDWHHAIVWDGVIEDPKSLRINIKLFDKDASPLDSDDPLGQANINVGDIPIGTHPSVRATANSRTDCEPSEVWYDIAPYGKMKEATGQVYVSARLEIPGWTKATHKP